MDPFLELFDLANADPGTISRRTRSQRNLKDFDLDDLDLLGTHVEEDLEFTKFMEQLADPNWNAEEDDRNDDDFRCGRFKSKQRECQQLKSLCVPYDAYVM